MGEFNNLPAPVHALIREFQTLRDRHYQVFEDLMKSAVSDSIEGGLHPAIATIALNRSLRLMTGYLALVERRNLTAASALIRMQLDSCMRVNACFLVSDIAAVLNALRAGDPFSQLTARDAPRQNLTDRFLREQLSTKYAWVSSVYEDTSGYIHMSKPHADAAIQGPAMLGMIVKLSEDEDAPDPEIDENAKLFLQVTTTLLEICASLSR